MNNIETAAAEVGGLRLPPGIEPIEVAGQGSRSIVFRVNYRGDILAMKVYRPEAIEKYRKKHDVNIGVYEMSRNRAFRKIPELLPFTAKPISVMGHDGRSSLIFLQEFIDGEAMAGLIERMGKLPESVVEAGEVIVRAAELNGLYQLDLDYRDAMVRKQSGVWQPVLHDFNHMVKKEEPSSSLLGKVFKSGKKKSQQDYKQLAEWRKLSN